MPQRYRLKFPPLSSQRLGQDEVFFSLVENGKNRRFRFHDYAEIYKRPGLYEQLFYDRLKCNSPVKVADLLKRALNTVREPVNELRVLDLGAGNGMMGEVLKQDGVARLVDADIIPEARDAAYRDRSESTTIITWLTSDKGCSSGHSEFKEAVRAAHRATQHLVQRNFEHRGHRRRRLEADNRAPGASFTTHILSCN